MAKRVSERATRGGEHGGVGTPHARGASGEALGVGSDEASSISFCLRARWLVSSLTRRCGGPPAHLPSGIGPGYGGASEREIGQPNPVGDGFASGMRSGRPNSLRGKCVEKKLFKKKQSTTWGVLYGFPVPDPRKERLRYHPAAAVRCAAGATRTRGLCCALLPRTLVLCCPPRHVSPNCHPAARAQLRSRVSP